MHGTAGTECIREARITLPSGEEAEVSVSGGYLIYPEVCADCTEMLHLADQAMYRVKKSGKGRFEKYGGPEAEEG